MKVAVWVIIIGASVVCIVGLVCWCGKPEVWAPVLMLAAAAWAALYYANETGRMAAATVSMARETSRMADANTVSRLAVTEEPLLTSGRRLMLKNYGPGPAEDITIEAGGPANYEDQIGVLREGESVEVQGDIQGLRQSEIHLCYQDAVRKYREVWEHTRIIDWERTDWATERRDADTTEGSAS